MGPNQIKRLLFSKGNNQQSERQSMDWEKIFANQISDKEFIFNRHKKILQFNNNNKPTNNLISKMGLSHF